ncbi:MAG: hypothetical protein M3541_03545, partial [Acidobacteriota bacterium]|nr:hypothetical protein [Acidobacteriota bacterium]
MARMRDGTPAIVAAIAVVAVLVGAAAGYFLRAPDVPLAMPGFAFDVAVPGKQIDAGSLALSPDGSHLAFRIRATDGTSEIWVRRFGEPAARPVQGTRDGRGSKPFWSPDGRYLGFFVGNDVWRIPVDGSAAQRIATAPNPPRGGTWGADDVVLLGTEGGPIYRIEAGGGTPPRAITTVDTAAEDMHVWPVFLPDGKQFVFLADASSDEGHRIRLASVEHGDSKILLSGIRSSPTVDPRGALMVVAQRSQLVSYPFDFKRGTLGRESHLGADRVAAVGDRHETPTTIAAHGILAYQTGATGADLVRIALDDGLTAAVATAERFANPAIAPNGRHVGFDAVQPEGGRLVWIHDLQRGVRTLVSERGVNADSPVWSPNADTLYFAASTGGRWQVYRKAVTGTASPESLGAPPESIDVGPLDCSRDGTYLLVTSLFRAGRRDLYLLPLDRPDAQWKQWAGDATPDGARFSPDSRWIAYTSTSSGRSEVYVSAVGDPSHRVQISSSGGTAPVWSPNADRLFYRSLSDQLMAVSVDRSGGALQTGAPQTRFDLHSASGASQRNVFDVTPDGKSILVVRRMSSEDVTIHVRTGVPRAR